MASKYQIEAKAGVNASGFKLGVKEMEGIANKFARDFKRSMGEAMVGWFGGAWVADKLMEALNKVLEKSKQITEASEAYDAPKERMSMWSEVAVKLGTDLNALIPIFTKLEQAKKDALEKGDSAGGKALLSMGFSQKDLIGKSGEQLAQELIEAFKKRGRPSSDAASMRELLGRGYGSNPELLTSDFERFKKLSLSQKDIDQNSKLQETREQYAQSLWSKSGKAVSSVFSWLDVAGTATRKAIDFYTLDAENYKKLYIDKPTIVKKPEKTPEQMDAIRKEADQKLLDDANAKAQKELEDKRLTLQKARIEKEATSMSGIFGKTMAGGDSFDKQGIFLRGAPSSSSIPNQQLSTQKSILTVVKIIADKSGTENYGQ